MSILKKVQSLPDEERAKLQALAKGVFGSKEGMQLLGVLTGLANWMDHDPSDDDFARGNKEITSLLWALAQPGQAPLIL